MNTMSAMITTRYIYLKLCKKGPNTHECVSIPTPAREKILEQLVFFSHSLSTNNRIQNRLSPKSYNLLY